MSSLTIIDRHALEEFFGMESGYVGKHSDRTFGELVMEAVGVDIHDQVYTCNGTSKANKLRTFWKDEPDARVGQLLDALLDYESATREGIIRREDEELFSKCKSIAARLRSRGPNLDGLKQHAQRLDARYLAEQIKRMEAAVDAGDTELALGTAKELIETCCKTILAERSESIVPNADVPELTKATLKALRLVPAGIPNEARGADVIKRILSNLATIGNGLAELRGLYGTGHGKEGTARGLSPRHAKLAVGASVTLVTFLFETHNETMK